MKKISNYKIINIALLVFTLMFGIGCLIVGILSHINIIFAIISILPIAYIVLKIEFKIVNKLL